MATGEVSRCCRAALESELLRWDGRGFAIDGARVRYCPHCGEYLGRGRVVRQRNLPRERLIVLDAG